MKVNKQEKVISLFFITAFSVLGILIALGHTSINDRQALLERKTEAARLKYDVVIPTKRGYNTYNRECINGVSYLILEAGLQLAIAPEFDSVTGEVVRCNDK